MSFAKLPNCGLSQKSARSVRDPSIHRASPSFPTEKSYLSNKFPDLNELRAISYKKKGLEGQAGRKS